MNMDWTKYDHAVKVAAAKARATEKITADFYEGVRVVTNRGRTKVVPIEILPPSTDEMIYPEQIAWIQDQINHATRNSSSIYGYVYPGTTTADHPFYAVFTKK